MSAIVTHKFRFNNAENFHDSFAASKYYMFVGRSEKWDDDNNPPIPQDSQVSESLQYRDMIAAKFISPSDVSYVVPRRNYTSGVAYDMYKHNISASNPAQSGATALWDSTFYVLTSDYNVYICIDNNNGGISTGEPTGTSTSIISGGDNYKWKYLYTLSTSAIQKHLSLDFMPIINDATIAGAAAKGGIEHIELISGGTGYTNGTYNNVVIHGDGIGGKCTVVVVGGIIDSVVVTDTGGIVNQIGKIYTFASIDYSQFGTGTGANINPIISPLYGHGADNIKELGAFFVMVTTTLTGEEGAGDFLINQDFRQIGLLKNPTEGQSLATSPTLSCLKTLTVSGFANTHFIIDEIITGSSSTGIGVVSDFDPLTGVLKYLQQSEIGSGLASDGDIDLFLPTITSPPSGYTADTITGSISGAVALVDSISSSEIDTYSGDILYVENRMPIPRADDQQENIKLIVEF